MRWQEKAKESQMTAGLMTESTAGIHITGTITAVRVGNYRSEENRGYQQEEYRRDYGRQYDRRYEQGYRQTDTEETAVTVRVIRAAAMTTGTMNRMTEENVQQRKRRETDHVYH